MADPSSSNPPANLTDIDSLSAERRATLDQYIAVTAQDVAAALPILQRSQWNVEIAIAKFFDGEGPDLVAEALAAQERDNARAAAAAARLPVPRPINPATLIPAPRIVPQPASPARRPPLVLAIILFPFSLLFRLSSGTFAIFCRLFPFLPRLLRLHPGGTTTTTRRLQNPRDTAQSFIRAFTESHPAHATALPWHEAGYASALDAAKRDLKFLLVVLLSPDHDDTQQFASEVLATPEVATFLSTNNMLLWGGSVVHSEAYQVSTALGASKFPFAALIAHTPGAGSQGMSVVARVGGIAPGGPAAFVRKLQVAVSQHSGVLDAAQLQRREREMDRVIREEQNSAYEISLARDRERARERREAQEREKREAEEYERAEKEALKFEQRRQTWRRWRKAQIVPEPAEGARVSIRTENGQRIVRKFSKEVRIEEVYAFVETLDMEEEEAMEVEQPEVGYEHEYKFRLASVMPRREFGAYEAVTVGDVLWPSGNLVVESVGDDDEEE